MWPFPKAIVLILYRRMIAIKVVHTGVSCGRNVTGLHAGAILLLLLLGHT